MSLRIFTAVIASLAIVAVPAASAKPHHSKHHARAQAKKPRPRPAFFIGTVNSASGNSMVVHISSASAWGKPYVNTDATFDVSRARIAGDAAPGAEVIVRADVLPGSPLTDAVHARWLVVTEDAPDDTPIPI
jgi:hypothetical protein